jgi:pimeloyl-ACP methyl ester carboxylesterase
MKGMLMFSPPLMDGLSARMVATARLNTHTLVRGPETGEPVVLVHGNVSAARFFEEVMLALPEHYYVLAPDMRGYGRSERKPVDATRGVRDFSDDLKAFVDALGLERFHLLGWSLGGNVALQYAIDYPADVRTLTLLAPGSPYGFGGSSGLDGTPNNAEYAGSGGGTANPAFVQAIAAGDRSAEQPISPRNVMNAFYFRPPFRSPREDVFVEEMLLTHVDPTHYPGDLTATTAWPGFGPGTTGVNNALSPKYLNQAAFATIDPARRCSGCAAMPTRSSATSRCSTWGCSASSAPCPTTPAPRSTRPSPWSARYALCSTSMLQTAACTPRSC